MVELKRPSLRALLGLATLVITPRAFAQEAPVERPSVGRPALPQPSQDQPAPVERPATAQPAPASPSPRSDRPRPAPSSPLGRGAGSGAWRNDKHPAFLYLGAGLGLLRGLGGGQDFERSNPAVTGLIGVELPLGGATGLGFELTLDAELAGERDRGGYTAALLRARLGQLVTPNARLWGAVGVGRAGYQTGSLAGAVAVGSTLLFVPKFGLDLSANLSLVGASSPDTYQTQVPSYDYAGGLVLLVAVKALFELHKTH